MELSKFKIPSLSNNFLLWAVVIFVVFGFGKSSSTLGFNFFGTPTETHKSSHKHYQNGKSSIVPPSKTPFPTIPFLGNTGGFLSGNGLFLIAIIAILFLCKDDKKETSYRETTVEDCNDVEN